MLHTNTPPASFAPTLAVSLEDIRPLRQLASGAGISLADILENPDLAPQALDESASVSLADYFRILERLAIAAHDETCGLSTRPLLPGATGLVLSNLASCTNLFEAMKAVANAYNLLHGGAYNRVELHEGSLVYVIDDSDFPYALSGDSAQVLLTMECVLIFLHGMLTSIAGEVLQGLLRKVDTKRAHMGSGCGYMNFWPVPIRWKSRHYALHYDLAATSLPIVHGGSAPSLHTLYRKVIDLVEHTQSSGRRPRTLLQRVTDAFDEGVYDQDGVANRLGLSVATLRRHLRAEGEPSFRALRDAALDRAAKALLTQGRHPSDIADELRFCDLRSFSRAFKRWNGTTPAGYLRRLGRPQR